MGGTGGGTGGVGRKGWDGEGYDREGWDGESHRVVTVLILLKLKTQQRFTIRGQQMERLHNGLTVLMMY